MWRLRFYRKSLARYQTRVVNDLLTLRVIIYTPHQNYVNYNDRLFEINYFFNHVHDVDYIPIFEYLTIRIFIELKF